MIVKLFAVADRISGVYDGPHKAINEGQFLRSFEEACQKGQIHDHPEDFFAVELGTWNDSNGELVPLEGGARRIADAADFVKGE